MIQKLIFIILAISLLGCFFDNHINQTDSLANKGNNAKALKASKKGLPLKESMLAFNDFVKALSTNQNVSTEGTLHDQAKLYFPDSTIYKDHYLFGHDIPSPDSFRILVYEYSSETSSESHFFITNFHPSGEAIDVLKAVPLSMDGNLSINLVDGEILELEYADFYLNPAFFESDRFYCKVPDSLQHTDSEQPIHLKKYLRKKDYQQLNFYENYKIDKNGQFVRLRTKNLVNPKRKYPFASSRVLSFEELNRYSHKQLEMMIHEIQADHGQIFETTWLRRYFRKKKWYDARYDNIEPFLNDIEKINIVKIQQQVLTF